MPATLVLCRHGESEYNKLNLFTGFLDPELSDKGKVEAQKGGQELVKGGLTKFDIAFTSALQRAQVTLQLMLQTAKITGLETKQDAALNERDYGELAGLNKDEAREKFGEEQVHIWRRSYDVPPPGGESLKMTAERVLPYYNKEIKPLLKEGKNVLVVAHGNSLRSLIMELEGLSGEEIVKKELATGIPYVYTDFDDNLKPKTIKVLE